MKGMEFVFAALVLLCLSICDTMGRMVNQFTTGYRPRRRGECLNGRQHGEEWRRGNMFKFRCNAGRQEFMGCIRRDERGQESVRHPGETWCDTRTGVRYTCRGSRFGLSWALSPVGYCESRQSRYTNTGYIPYRYNRPTWIPWKPYQPYNTYTTERRTTCWTGSGETQHGGVWYSRGRHFKFRCNAGKREFLGCVIMTERGEAVYPPNTDWCDQNNIRYVCRVYNMGYMTRWAIQPYGQCRY